jgi:signal transduction histidine kinase
MIGMAVMCITPAWLGAAFLVQTVYYRDSDRDIGRTVMTARALLLAVDRELASAQTAAEILAASPHLASGDLAAFHRVSAELVPSLFGTNVVITDISGQQVVSTLRPSGEMPPQHGNEGRLRRVFTTGKPAISDVFIGGVVKRPLVAIDVPVFRGVEVRYALSIGLFPDRLRELLVRQDLPPGWVASIFDSAGVVVTRTRSPEQFIGKKGAPALVEALATSRSGVVRTSTLDGIPVYAAFSRSDVSNWTVAIEIPVAEVTRDLYKFLEVSAAGALLLLALGISLAVHKSNRIARALHGLIAPALALGRGEAPAVIPTGIRESDEVGRALTGAFDLLQHRTDERDRAEQEKDVLARAARLKGEFVGTVSHELRTPLTSICAALGLLVGTANGNLSDSGKRLVSIAHENCQRLIRLINDLLDFEKLEAGKVVFDIKRVVVPTLVKHAIDVNRPLAESCEVTLRAEQMAPDEIRADPDRLIQVLTNLLSNAVKFSPRGGKVAVTAQPWGEWLRISVWDQGPGIPPQFRAHIFEAFAQAESTDAAHKAGTGLGLSIVKQIVTRLGGQVGFADAPGGGTVFHVDLPRLATVGGPSLIPDQADAATRERAHSGKQLDIA